MCVDIIAQVLCCSQLPTFAQQASLVVRIVQAAPQILSASFASTLLGKASFCCCIHLTVGDCFWSERHSCQNTAWVQTILADHLCLCAHLQNIDSTTLLFCCRSLLVTWRCTCKTPQMQTTSTVQLFLQTISAQTIRKQQINLLYGCRSHLTVSDCVGAVAFFTDFLQMQTVRTAILSANPLLLMCTLAKDCFIISCSAAGAT